MKIVLSYSSSDADIGQKFSKSLQQFGIEVWTHWENVTTIRTDTFKELQTAIESSDAVVVLLLPSTVSSDRVLSEVIYASHRKITILPVSFKGIEVDPTSIPLTLLNYQPYVLTLRFSEDTKSLENLVNTLKQQISQVQKVTLSEQELILNRKRILERNNSRTRIFIAYSRKQKIVAEKVFQMLLSYGHAVFWDAKIKAGATWRQTIQKALDDATHVVVIWTPEAAHSDEVEREVSYALAERKVIVPLLSKEIPKLPYHLHGLHYLVLPDDLKSIEADLVQAIELHTQDDDLWE